MRKFLNTLCFFAFLSVSSYTTQAQVTLFGSLLEQLDSTDQANFLDNFDNFPSLDSLNGIFTPDSLDFDGNTLDSLFTYLDSIPNLDTTFLDAFAFGADSLGILGDTTLLPYFDSLNIDTIIGEYAIIDTIFMMNYDSLDDLFDNFGDSLQFDPSIIVDLSGEDTQEDIDENLMILYDSLSIIVDSTDEVNAGTFGLVFEQLFAAENFTKLELAFGVQEADFNYYGTRYSPKAKVVRVGSVPDIKTDNVFGSSWHMQVSFMDGNIEDFNTSDNGNGSNNGVEDFVPLMLGADYAFMANPIIFSSDNVDFRLLTSLGMEIETYAPSHSDFSSETADNQGFVTGLGLQVGTGFGIRFDEVTVYSKGSYAFGDVVKCEGQQYRYSSLKMSAGVVYSDKINIRYTAGRMNWANDDNKRFDLNHQITLGIILAELRR